MTFLFTDIEGSTRLLERLGVDRYGEVLDVHRDLLRDAIASAGGVVVSVQGDSTFAAFASAAAAVGAAVAAQRALAAQSWPEGVTARVRSGLHTGEARVSGGDYVGMAVHRARRVCDAGHGGQVLMSSATEEALRGELPADVRIEDLGEVRLAGFEAPERLVGLLIEGLPQAFPELRALRPWREQRPVLLERGEELAAIDAGIASALAGAGRVVVVEGPAGIGKSSVLAEARSRAADAGLSVLQARGSELEAAFSYGVVRQLLEPLVAQASTADRASWFEGAAAHAARLFEGDQGAAAAPSEDAAFALLHGLYWLTANLAESRPLAIAIDDLQSADAPSLRWLSYLMRRLDGLPICVLATVRHVEDEQPLLTELLADPAITSIRPSALTAPAVAELVRERLSPEAGEAFCLACHRMTGGNPLLLHELLRTLAAEDVAPVAASVDAVERLAPDAVARSVRLRLSRLAPEAVSVARAVAVLGDGSERAPAAALAGIERRAAAAAAAALARVDLLRHEPPLRFIHPLVRNAVYESIPGHEREQEHARAAEVLAAAGAPPEQVAAQILLAPPDSVEGAVGALREAARRAAGEGGLESASTYLLRALEEPLDRSERGELLLELAAAEFSLGRPSVVERLREALSVLPDARRRGAAALELARAQFFWSSDQRDAVETLEAALAEPDLDHELRLHLESELIANAIRIPALHADARRRVEAIDVDAAQGPGARLILGIQSWHESTLGLNLERCVQRAQQALSSVLDEERSWSYWGAVYTLMFADRYPTAFRVVDSIIADASKSGAAFNFSGALMIRAMLGTGIGSLVEAESDARTAIDALPHRDAMFMPHAYGWLMHVLVERGALDDAATALEAIEANVGAVPETFLYAPILRSRAMLRAARGDHRSALADFLAIGRIFDALSLVNPVISYPPWRSGAALEHHALGDERQALDLARAEVDLARQWGAPRGLGRALRVLGLIEGGSDGIEHTREAIAVLEDSPARLEHAYALADLGAVLRRANRRAEAREHLHQALELAQRCGANLLVERAHEELIATGARPRRLVRTGVDALTPSERRIAAMAAEGLSNREIAQALFVTLRTVEMHLSNAFRKLDISSRTQLPGALASSAPPLVAGTA